MIASAKAAEVEKKCYFCRGFAAARLAVSCHKTQHDENDET